MTKRLTRPAIAFLLVLGCYWLYGFIAVPLIAPPVTFACPPEPASPAARSTRSFTGLFPPGSWELGQPKVLETGQGTLLFDDYTSLPDGSIELNRCTLVYYLGSHSADSSSRGGSGSRPVVMRAMSGATIHFDGPLNLFGGQLGRVIGGRLKGEVTIFSPPSRPGAADELEIVTQSVQIRERRIWTPHLVRFHYGPNRGTGRDLSIELLPRRERGRRDGQLGQIKSLDLVHLDFIEIQADVDLFPLADHRPAERTTHSSARSPIEIRCQGPLHFDFPRNLVTLSDHVDVIQHNSSGPSDQLSCELLELHMAAIVGSGPDQRGEERPADRSAQQGSSWQPKKIVATGYPVIVRVPSNGSSARAERIEFEFDRRRLWLKDSNELILQTSSFEVKTRELEYEIPAQGQLGRLWAAGPGTLDGVVEGRRLSVQWSQEVRMVKQSDSHVLSVLGAASASVPGESYLKSDQIHVYLLERPAAEQNGRAEIVVQRMHASGQVNFDSPRLSGEVGEAKIWFEPSPPQSPIGTPNGDTPGSAVAQSKPAAGGKKFHLTGDRLHAQVLMGDPPQLKRLSINGRVLLREVAGTNRPSALSGEHLELESDELQQVTAQLVGQPAEVSLRGLVLAGGDIALSQADNRVSIQGPGAMTLPRQKRAEATGVAVPPIRIRWTTGMDFDGQRSTFEGEVRVTGGRLTKKDDLIKFAASSDKLEIGLTQRLDFQQSDVPDDVVHKLSFPDWVTIEEVLSDRLGKQKSKDQMRVRDLEIDLVSGQIHAEGPGWLVHRGPMSDFTKNKAARLPLAGSSSQLAYLKVNFEREMTGNQFQREIVFTDRILSVYGPIDSWEESLSVDSRRSLRQRDVMLTCQELAVFDMKPASDELEALEFQATGNATILGQSFSGTGERISYSQHKDQLILKGDGRNHAFLRFRKLPAADPVELRFDQVLFYPGSKHFKVPMVYSLEIPDSNQLRTTPPGNLSPPR